MGVHGLWDLLSPVGRRVSVETLAGKRLAIDASIWMIQFMKAMRDERGEMVRNAHILGFFRRICKLLFLRTKPVFVFDGATPALKRRTVIARRRQRENAQAKIRKTAEKLLLNHLKAMRLKELANDLENQRKSNHKGKRVITDEADLSGTTAKMTPADTMGFDQEAIDAMLAASIEAEEGGGFIGDASTSGAGVLAEDEDGEDDEEMLLPTLQGKVDPAVLASLPPSMQLDLLVQMRERLMAENRQKYQIVKKAPARFSELQIEAYLKTVAFRREINEVQKVAGGRGVGGVQTSRIASEANREFIFSSSFTGNRQSLASAGVEANNNVQSQIATRSDNANVSTSKSNSTIESIINNPKEAFNEDVEMYRDERGRVRVNKMKAMGIRMTRDLQRNLDLMKEIEKDKTEPVSKINAITSHSKATEFSSKLLEGSNEINQESIPVSGTTIEFSIEDNNEQQFADSDDDVFAQIVAGDPLVASSADNTSSVKQQPNITVSDCEWEEGMPGEIEGRPFATSDESEVEWEEGPSDNPELGSACKVEQQETVSKGDLLEEADFQEAIRRSLDDMRYQKDSMTSSTPQEFNDDKNMDATLNDIAAPRLSSECVAPNKSSVHVDATTINDPSVMEVQMGILDGSDKKYHHELSITTASDDRNSQAETRHVDLLNSAEDKGVDLSNEWHEDSCRENVETLNSCKNVSSFTATHISSSPDVSHAAAKPSELKAHVGDHIPEMLEAKGTVVEELKSDFVDVRIVTEESDYSSFYEQGQDDANKFISNGMSEEQVEITKANLEEEMTNLTKERSDLNDKQRRLERNAESVSGEMFAECQELLQMFGLPYIIAPMEAEAQCAYMELENLVDGVVTDDSDVLLFGARSVYKNIFDDRKYVETYFMKDIESELGLSREKLIRMAMLLGSDYTEGISGIGIVNAVEVINAFPEEDGLHKFREWIESPDPTILGKVDAKYTVDQVSYTDDDIKRKKQIFMDKHRNVSKNWHIPSTFPSDAVISAYSSPQVDKSTEPFSWGKPDLFVLRKLCFEKFGWGTKKADELLQPVLKEYNKHETQLRLEAFYTFNERFAKIRSKRISKAVKGIAGSKSSDLMDYDLHPLNEKKRKKVKHAEGKIDAEKERLTTIPKETSELLVEEGHRKGAKKVSSVGRRGRGQSAGRGTRKRKNNLELSGTSSDDGNNNDHVQEVHAEHTNGLRKSKRVRKSVKYANNEESDTDEPKIQEIDDEVTGKGKPSEQEEALVRSVVIGVGGSNYHESPPPGTRVDPDDAGLGKDWCQNDENVPESELSKEYLKMGGGFCLDEDKDDKKPQISGRSPLTHGLNEVDHGGEAEESISPDGATDLAVGVSLRNKEDVDGLSPVSYLSAMPNLRRKRKKA